MPLPIDEVLPQLVEALRTANCAVLRAPTGAGKTTRVPPALLDAGLAGSGQIVLLQPRRLAARAAAARIAAERNVSLGGEVGYQVRFERCADARTRILCATEGILLRRLQDDALLERVGMVLFDEFHERSLNADVALAMVRRVQTEVRPDLKIVVMSATLAAEPVARYLGDCPTVESTGRLHPVAIRYLPHEPSEPEHRLAAQGVEQILAKTSGDVLVFLPGVGEIRRTAAELEPLVRREQLLLMELYGDLPLDQQQRVLARAERRKIVLATNVAETSVTIEGVTGVVDTGTARVLRTDPGLGLNRLEVERISRASADQRTGRAGRTAPGVCLRLWTERRQQGLVEFETPEVRRVDLAGAALELLCWGEADLAAFPWYEPPPPAALTQARALLERLGAIDAQGPTELGRTLARLPVHPRLGVLLVEGHRRGDPRRAALAAALWSERDPFLRSPRGATQHWSPSDMLDRVAALEEWERHGGRETSYGEVDTGRARFILRARDQLLHALIDELGAPAALSCSADEALLRGLLAALPDRVARRRAPGSRRARMVGGRGVRLDDRSAVIEPELFVCVDIEEKGHAEALVRIASGIEPQWLPEATMERRFVAEFDPHRERVMRKWQRLYEDLVLDEGPAPALDDEVQRILAAAAWQRFPGLFELDQAARDFVGRVQFLRQSMPDLDLKAIDEPAFQAAIWQWCAGKESLDELRRGSLLPFLQTAFTFQQLQTVEREAPERLQVPSGSRIALRYEAGKPPVLAVRIQEVFGLRETPRVAGCRVPVLLHLLGPNQRVEQITDDLASFWKNTYPQVRKDLRRRYPKHAWPEDPYTATAERRPTNKKKSRE